MSFDTSLHERDSLWGLLLGKKFNKVSSEEPSLSNLVSEFSSNKQELIRFHYGTVPQLVEKLSNVPPDEGEDILLYLWGEYEWRKQSTGKRFEIDSPLTNILDELEGDGNVVYRLKSDFALVWNGREVYRHLIESNGVNSTIQREAKRVLIKQLEDGDKIEVRGPSRLLDSFTEDLSESDDLSYIKPEPTEEPVLENLSNVFEASLSSMTLVEVKIGSSNLPGRSKVALSNQEGISDDLSHSSIRPEIIDQDSLADLEYLKFLHEKSGIKLKMKVIRNDEGFYFELDDSNLPENEKKNARQLLENKTGISFEKLYPYDIQHHTEYIVNQILTGNKQIYQKYYLDLDSDAKEFVDRFVNASGQNIFKCFECDEIFYYVPEGERNCGFCGKTLHRIQPELNIDIQKGQIESEVSKCFSEFDFDVTSSKGTRLLGVDSEAVEIDDHTYIESKFQLAESAGSAMAVHHQEFHTYCLGNGQLPKRIGEYLLDCVLVTYGKANINGRENFGTISLYNLFRSENPGRLFADAVKKSKSNLRNRVREETDEARNRLLELQQLVEEGTIEEADRDKRNELKSDYGYNKFEKDVFYLLKSMFLLTERWGREGKKETDGCVIIPRESDNYFVASYDPKLTYSSKGYNLDANEKNKAAYYILSESNHEYISETLKDGGNIDCHIFISDIFRQGQYSTVSDTVQDWFSLTENRDNGTGVPVTFLSVENLLDLYEVFDSNYNFIIEYPKVQRAFRKEIQRQLTGSEDYVVVDTESVKKVKERVLEARATVDKKKSVRNYSS